MLYYVRKQKCWRRTCMKRQLIIRTPNFLTELCINVALPQRKVDKIKKLLHDESLYFTNLSTRIRNVSPREISKVNIQMEMTSNKEYEWECQIVITWLSFKYSYIFIRVFLFFIKIYLWYSLLLYKKHIIL